MIGKKILHYNITEKLGEGGMGVVYKAEDTKLERTVAIKLLPAHLLTSADDRARFNREAKAAAALNHPNIATVYEINEHEGKPFIVMEYVEGKTLNDALEKELFKLKDAISIAIQAAEGLKAAHAKNIVHRDIKSGNVLLSNDGQAKILDFGLAKTAMSTKLTKMGSTLGTVAYMSPEQISTQEVDHRTDLWSLGVVMFEMLTGRFPFSGEYDQAIFYNILNEPPEPLTAIRSGIPMSLEWIVNKLLAKNPDERYQNANDLIIDLKAVDLKSTGMSRISSTAIEKPVTKKSSQSPPIESEQKLSSKRNITKPIPFSITLLLVAIIAAVISWHLHPKPVKELRKFQWPSDYDIFVLSPDGKKIAFSKGEQLWIRYLDKIDPVEIKGDKTISNIIWSPGSDNVAYFTGFGTAVDHQLRRVSVSGVGDVLIVKTAGNYYPRFWGIDDSILVTTWDNTGTNTLLKVPSSGGELVPICGRDSTLSTIRGDLTHVLGLPDGKTLLLSNNPGDNRSKLIVQTKEKRTTIYNGPPESYIGRPVYSNSGHILLTLSTRNSYAIWAIPFNASSLESNGSPFLVARNGDQLSISKNGMLSYNINRNSNSGEQLVLLSRSGQILENIGQPQSQIYSPAVSPDGNMVATTSQEETGGFNIWLFNIAKGIQSQLSFDVPETWAPSWSPDGKKIVFASGFTREANIYVQTTNSSASAKPLIHTSLSEQSPFWSADGRYILFSKAETKPRQQSDLWYLEINNDSIPKRLFESRFNEGFPYMSPDGRFVTFQSDKSGQMEIYVTNFPEADKQWQVSYNGGIFPQWIDDEIFFIEPRQDELMLVKAKANPEFQSEIPQKLFSSTSAGVLLRNNIYLKYAVTRDGKNIIAVKDLSRSDQSKLVLVENWFEEFKDKK
jgi:serine/threonine protein kinase